MGAARAGAAGLGLADRASRRRPPRGSGIGEDARAQATGGVGSDQPLPAPRRGALHRFGGRRPRHGRAGGSLRRLAPLRPGVPAAAGRGRRGEAAAVQDRRPAPGRAGGAPARDRRRTAPRPHRRHLPVERVAGGHGARADAGVRGRDGSGQATTRPRHARRGACGGDRLRHLRAAVADGDQRARRLARCPRRLHRGDARQRGAGPRGHAARRRPLRRPPRRAARAGGTGAATHAPRAGRRVGDAPPRRARRHLAAVGAPAGRGADRRAPAVLHAHDGPGPRPGLPRGRGLGPGRGGGARRR